MDGELLRHLYHEVFHRGKITRPKRCDFSDETVLFVYFIGVIHNRSTLWASRKPNWPLWARRLVCPSYSQIRRRLQTQSVQARLERLQADLRHRLPRTNEKVVDGKPLLVGGYSKDADARWGKLPPRGWAKGYKLHAVTDASGVVEAFAVTPLPTGEATVARSLLAPLDLSGATVRGDANYDSNALYALTAERGGRFLAPRRRPGRGLGKRRHHPDRLRAIRELEQGLDAKRSHRRHRNRIEQAFGHLTNLPFGLSPLPNCVRRLTRVQQWVQAKIVLYHLHLALRQTAANAA